MSLLKDNSNPEKCVVCSRPVFQPTDPIDDTPNDTCEKCFNFLVQTSPLMNETKLFHFRRLLDKEFENMQRLLKIDYDEYEDTSYLDPITGESIYRK